MTATTQALDDGIKHKVRRRARLALLLVVWRQMLRTEKLVLRKARWRLLKKTRKRVRRYVNRKTAKAA
ncbi:MAG: hypothetical protein B7Z12_03140 [Caulobacter vibrioides]|uniref:Uncharacterized protein n=1 Tax=Caulobacter vibrioides TaxID=155892 RepID=A0A258DCM6_CAUVI|nr:MAG: hypothetical protein B7Z12_03140 [Caulobacter vibrioides]